MEAALEVRLNSLRQAAEILRFCVAKILAKVLEIDEWPHITGRGGYEHVPDMPTPVTDSPAELRFFAEGEPSF